MKRLALTVALFALTGPVSAARAEVGPEFPDNDVRDAIEREVLLDRAVPSHRIDVKVRDGVASLSGEVPNLLAKERAARIAGTVKGVRSVVNLVEVSPPRSKSDEKIQQDVKAALLSDPAADSYEVQATTHDGHVVLSGTVDSWQEKELCATVAKGVDGVLDLTNQITVHYESDRPDSEIALDVEESLRWNALVDHGLIEVEVADGEVRLSGTVGSTAEKNQARNTAFVAGVQAVDDSGLTVSRWARDDDLRKSKYVYRSPEEVEAAVESALSTDPRVRSFNVEASVAASVVSLRGVVDNLKAKRAAEQDARNTVGVSSVENYLKVRPAVERGNYAIEQEVLAALTRDPFVERHEITVGVYDGTVYLFGAVDSQFEKGQADDLASRIDGVTDVVNKLEVDDRPFGYDPYVDHWSIYSYPWYGHAPYYTLDSDWEIRRDIRDELFWSPFVDADEVQVTVEDGVAILTGTVESWMERGAARDNAIDGGATRVRNELVIESSSEGTSVQ